MPIEVHWLNQEERFLLLHFVDGGIEDWSEYDNAVAEAWSMATDVQHPVIAIFAAYDVPMPAGSPLPHIKQAIASHPDNIQLAISIIERNFEKMMVDMVAQLNIDERVHTVSSWDAVNRLLASKNLPLVPFEDIPPRK